MTEYISSTQNIKKLIVNTENTISTKFNDEHRLDIIELTRAKDFYYFAMIANPEWARSKEGEDLLDLLHHGFPKALALAMDISTTHAGMPLKLSNK